jgi:hypothetical protein
MSKHKLQEFNEAEWFKRKEEQDRREKQRIEEHEREQYGVVTYSRKSVNSPEVTVVPVEIEVPWALDQFVKGEILDQFGRSYDNWIQECYLHRMKEIITNPAEFGKVVLEAKKRDHGLSVQDLVEDC